MDNYVSLMSQYRFGEVESFAQHQFRGEGGDCGTSLRTMKRLCTEYSDLRCVAAADLRRRDDGLLSSSGALYRSRPNRAC